MKKISIIILRRDKKLLTAFKRAAQSFSSSSKKPRRSVRTFIIRLVLYLYKKQKEPYIQDAMANLAVALLAGILLKYLFGIG